MSLKVGSDSLPGGQFDEVQRLPELLAASHLPPDVSLRHLWLRGGYAGARVDSNTLIDRWFNVYIAAVSDRELHPRRPGFDPVVSIL